MYEIWRHIVNFSEQAANIVNLSKMKASVCCTIKEIILLYCRKLSAFAIVA